MIRPWGKRAAIAGAILLGALLVVRFNTALNAADTDALRRFWVERNDFRRDRGPFAKGSFRWFSITNSPSPGHKRHFVGYQPKRAIKYVRKHKGLRLQLTEVSVEGGRAGRAENACRVRHVTRASGDNPAPSEKPVDDFCP